MSILFTADHYRSLFDSIDQGFCTIEVLFDELGKPYDYRFLEVNGAFERQTGLTDVVGRTIREMAPAHEDHWFRVYGEVAVSGTPVRFEQGAAALNRWYDVYAFRVGDPALKHVAVLFNDIRERKQAQDALHASEVKLRGSEAAHAIARGEAEQANRAKDQFLAMLGHELRNPLAPMVTALQLMRMRGLASREQDVLERQVKHLTRMVDDLLDVSRITRGTFELHKQRIELREIISRSMETAEPLLNERQNRVDVQVAAEGLLVNVDRDRIAQVVSNLLTNAAKYSDPGSRIAITASREADLVVLRISDEGVGIPSEMLQSVFEAFVQNSQSLDRSAGGLGLGLAIVRSLVNAHGGTVRAESDGFNRGSQFIVELPAADAAASAPTRSSQAR